MARKIYRYPGPAWVGQQLVVELDNAITVGLAAPLEIAIDSSERFPGLYEARTDDIVTPQLRVRPGYPNASGHALEVALDADDLAAPYG